MERVHLVHEFFTLVVLEDSAESANRFRNQEGFLEAWGVERGGVELHEFNVLECCPCTGGNGHAVPTTVRGAYGVLPNTACSACRKHCGLGVKVFYKSRFLVDDFGTNALLCLACSFAD